jgi:phage-related protein
MVREVVFWGDYFEFFYSQQDHKVRRKINYVLWLIRYTERVPEKFLKHLEDSNGLYEVRVSTSFKEIRILGFFDEDKLIVMVNCFVKKSQKTPKKELELGQKLKQEYFNHKVKNTK